MTTDELVSELVRNGIDVVSASRNGNVLRLRFRKELAESQRCYLLNVTQPAKATFLDGDSIQGIVVVLELIMP